MKVVDPYRFVSAVPFGGESWSLNGIDEYVSISDANIFSFGNGTTDSAFSLTGWIKMNDASNFCVVSKYPSTSSLREWILYFDSSDRMRGLLYDGSAGGLISRRSTASFTANEGSWAFVAMTYDGTQLAAGINLYLDNVVVGDSSPGSGLYYAMENTTSDVHIGEFATIEADGIIADIIIWDKELTVGNVNDIYNGGIPRDEAAESLSGNIVGFWSASDGGENPNDLSGNGNNGTGVNMDASNVVADYPS